MFWGLIMEPERRYSQQVKKPFHISMAALDVSSSDKEPAQVMCSYEDRNYLLCTLRNPDLLQCTLDLEFAAGSEVSFASNGNANIHLTGYLTDFNEDGLNLEDLEEQEEEEDGVEEVRDKRKKKQKITSPPKKKAKLLNGSMSHEEDEEEESDNDYEEENDEEESDSNDEIEGEHEEESENEEEEVEEEEEEKVQQKPSKKEKNKLKQEQAKSKSEPAVKKQVLKGGVIIQDIKEGNGPKAQNGRFINVYYEGRLEKNNKMFDSLNKGPGFKFRLGAGEVIKGWDIGLAGMKVGGVRKIICPPNTAYGAKGSPPAIPPASTLVFTVTLKKVH